MQVFKKIMCILCCIVSTNSLIAQAKDTLTKKNTIGIKYGYDRSYLKDINFSPLNYIGNGDVFDLSFKRTTKKGNLFFSQFDLTSTTFTSKAPTPISVSFDSDRILANLEIGFLKKINLNHPKLHLMLGGSYHSYVDVTIYKNSHSLTFLVNHGIDFKSKIKYQIHDKHSISGSVSLSVFGLLVRPPYTGWNKFIDESSLVNILTKGKWTSLNDFLGTTLNINYVYELAPRWSLEAQYRLRFYKTKHLKLAKIATSQTSLAVNFKF